MRILLLDTETSLHLVYTFRLFKTSIPPCQIKEPSRMLCWAAKWLGNDKIHFRNEHHKDFIIKIHQMINEADAIIHYNGKAFDMKVLNREFLLRRMDPPSSYTNIDLLTAFRKNFAFASNKLEWTSLQLGYEGKIQHRGIQLWFDVMANKRKAWKEMRTYNEQDVYLLEGVYADLKPWIQDHPNWGHYVDGDVVCRNCGSSKVKKDGWERRTVVPYQRYRCTDCGTPLKGRKKVKELPQPSTV